jgi:hypothetical protein
VTALRGKSQRNGFSMRNAANFCPCCMSSLRTASQPLSKAAATIEAS